MIQIGLREAKRLVGKWPKGTFSTVAESIRYHFMRHGGEVATSNVWQFLRKAEAFGEKLRGAKVRILENGAARYMKKRLLFNQGSRW